MKTKVCAGCQQEKPADEFYKYRWSKDGLRPRCIACMRPRLNETNNARIIEEREFSKEVRAKIRQRLGFFPDKGCERCDFIQQCHEDGIYVDPPCMLSDYELDDLREEIKNREKAS